MNKCDLCGKFRKSDDLTFHNELDYYGDLESYSSCKWCQNREYETTPLWKALNKE